MAKTERKYSGNLTLGKLEIALEDHEQLFGDLGKLEAHGGYTIAEYDDKDYPPLQTLALLPMIGGQTPPAPPNSTHLLNGEATVLGAVMKVSVFRTS